MPSNHLILCHPLLLLPLVSPNCFIVLTQYCKATTPGFKKRITTKKNVETLPNFQITLQTNFSQASLEISLAVQWLRFRAPNAGALGSITYQGIKISHASLPKKKKMWGQIRQACVAGFLISVNNTLSDFAKTTTGLSALFIYHFNPSISLDY